jgi:uncharacterized GH25 family protein
MKPLALLPAIVSMLFLAAHAHAHQIWIEQTNQTATLQFGEFGENLRETTPGLLDKFVQPGATLLSAKGEQALTLNKTADGFTLSALAAPGDSIVAEETYYPVIENKRGDTITRLAWTPAARYITNFSQQQPKLTLDILPTGKAGEFKVFYKGLPLPKAKVAAVVQSGWAREATANEQGLVSFDLPWRGKYVLEAQHSDKSAGERHGKSYDVASYVTTLSFVQLTGSAPLPAGSAVRPNK